MTSSAMEPLSAFTHVSNIHTVIEDSFFVKSFSSNVKWLTIITSTLCDKKALQ